MKNRTQFLYLTRPQKGWRRSSRLGVPIMFAASNVTRRLFSRRMASSKSTKVDLTEEEWQVKLNPEQFRVLRQKGTEKPGSGSFALLRLLLRLHAPTLS